MKQRIKTIEPAVVVEDIVKPAIPTKKAGEQIEPSSLRTMVREHKNELTQICLTILLLSVGLTFEKELHNTPFRILEYVVFMTAYLISGWGVISGAARSITKGRVFNEHFLMAVATLGAIAIDAMPEAVTVMLFYVVGELFQDIALTRSRKSIRALLDIRPDYANVTFNGEVKRVSPTEVHPGQIIVVKPGEKIPLDGTIREGNSFVDTSALTGESVPRAVNESKAVLAGMINKGGLLTIEVTKEFGESSISKILELVENASSKKAETEKFITTFARYYTPVVVFGALLLAVVPPLFVAGQTSEDWIYRALVVLVISCPCALVISIPLGYFGGIGGASRRGILVKGSNYLDVLTKIKTVVFDKTGTLTKGEFKVVEIVTQNVFMRDEILRYAAFAESHSNHPIAKAIVEAYGKSVPSEHIEQSSATDVQEVSGKGVKARVNGKHITLGNDRMLHMENIRHDRCEVEGTVVHVAVDSLYAGYIVISDSLKDDSLDTIRALARRNIDAVMLTGDNKTATEPFARKLEIREVYAELLPEDKVRHIERIIHETSSDGKVAFVGDGINDAPVIARADVGIAMGALGSDAAVETADVVLMTDSPMKVVDAIDVARRTRRIVWQNIGFALGVKLLFVLLGALGVATMWEAVFGDMGVATLAILNAMRVMR